MLSVQGDWRTVGKGPVVADGGEGTGSGAVVDCPAFGCGTEKNHEILG